MLSGTGTLSFYITTTTVANAKAASRDRWSANNQISSQNCHYNCSATLSNIYSMISIRCKVAWLFESWKRPKWIIITDSFF